MMIARYKNGFDGLMPRTFNQLFDNVINEATGGRSAQAPFALRVDAWETPESFEIQAAVPGFAKEDVNLELGEGKLTISGERRFERKENFKYHILESSFGRFSRVFNVPDNVNLDGISATFENGMLKISLPKDEQKVQRRKIEIKDGSETTIQLESTEKGAEKPKPSGKQEKK